jgi:hypothetical protein
VRKSVYGVSLMRGCRIGADLKEDGCYKDVEMEPAIGITFLSEGSLKVRTISIPTRKEK